MLLIYKVRFWDLLRVSVTVMKWVHVCDCQRLRLALAAALSHRDGAFSPFGRKHCQLLGSLLRLLFFFN